MALGYKDVVDPSVYVRLRVSSPGKRLHEGDSLLIWTTTPWTLPGNVAVAAGPEIEYARVRSNGETLVLANALVERVLGQDAEILDTFPGSELIGESLDGTPTGASYTSPIFPTSGRDSGAAPIVPGDFVTTEDGTGLVHIAPAFGEDDFNAAAAAAGLFDPTEPRHALSTPSGAMAHTEQT